MVRLRYRRHDRAQHSRGKHLWRSRRAGHEGGAAAVAEATLSEAREVLLEKVRIGNITLEDAAAEDEAVAMLYRYARAAHEGAAREALRLLACVMRGELAQPKPAADAFHRWADILASLSRTEMIVLAELHKQSAQVPEVAAIMRGVRERLIGEAKLFPEDDRLVLTLTALTRTGLVIPSSGWGGGIFYKTSPLMGELVALIGWEEFADEAVA